MAQNLTRHLNQPKKMRIRVFLNVNYSTKISLGVGALMPKTPQWRVY